MRMVEIKCCGPCLAALKHSSSVAFFLFGGSRWGAKKNYLSRVGGPHLLSLFSSAHRALAGRFRRPRKYATKRTDPLFFFHHRMSVLEKRSSGSISLCGDTQGGLPSPNFPPLFAFISLVRKLSNRVLGVCCQGEEKYTAEQKFFSGGRWLFSLFSPQAPQLK